MKALHASFAFARFTTSIRVLSALLAIALFAIPGPASAQTVTVGRTTAGTIASAGLSANFKRGSKFAITQAGVIRDFCMFLDGNGGVSGSQTVRFAVYKDANGVPGQKILESYPSQ
jgi:hypothetical protein